MDTDISTQMDHVVKLLQQILHMQRVSSLSDEQVFRFNVNGETIHMALPDAQLDFIQRVTPQTGHFFDASLLSQVAKIDLIGHNKIVYNIGANIVNHSVYFERILGAQTIVSCEPQPHVHKTFQRNLKLNGLATKNAFKVMLGDAAKGHC